MDYGEAKTFLDSLINYEREAPRAYDTRAFDLENFARLLARLGSPQEAFPILHVAGTKGKGSVVAVLAAAFAAAGRRAGTFTSPHLRSVRERLTINGEPIAKKDFGRVVAQAREAMTGEEEANYRTFFETLLAAALLYFRAREAEVAILETGLGGRLDATNVVTPAVVAITAIGLDHTNILGTALAEIAAEKAGVIKPGVPTVSAPQTAEVMRVIQGTAADRGAPVSLVGSEVHFSARDDGTFDYRGPRYELSGLKPAMAGPSQRVNAAVALATLELCDAVAVEPGEARRGLETGRARGRAELIPGNPPILLDTSHTAESARELAAVIESVPAGKKVLVWGMSADKDTRAYARVLAPYVEEAIATAASVPRARAAVELADETREIFGAVEAIPSPAEAFSRACEAAGEDGLVVVAGSFYLAGEVLTIREGPLD